MSTEQKQRKRSTGQQIRRWSLTLLGVIVLGIVVFLLMPAPVEPAVWSAPAAPSFEKEGPWKENNKLSSAELVTDRTKFPEFITFDKEGRLYAGDSDGKIYRVTFDAEDKAQPAEVFADTHGTPNGLKFDAAGNLIVADIQKGLLSIDPNGNIEVLTTEVDGGRSTWRTNWTSRKTDRFISPIPLTMAKSCSKKLPRINRMDDC